MISNSCIEVHTSPVDCPSVPAWLAEVVIIVQHLRTGGLLEAFAHEIRLVRGRFGSGSPHRCSGLADRLCHQCRTDVS